MKWFIWIVLGLLLLLLVWGVAIEPYFIDEREEVAVVPGLPAAWEGQQVALIADLQVGMWLGNTSTVRRIVARIVERRPSLVLIAGDFVYHPIREESVEEAQEEFEPDDYQESRDEINEVVALLRPLTAAGLPTYAVLGNHDYGMEWPEGVKLESLAHAVRTALETAGVKVLDNEATPIAPAGSQTLPEEVKDQRPPLYLIGIGSHFAGNDDPAVALARVPDQAPRIVMMHNPDSFAPFAVAGHTHGGQIRLPFLPEWSWMALLSEDIIHTDGWIHGYGQPGNRLYVNRGIGFSLAPIRINCRPELTFFTLRAAS